MRINLEDFNEYQQEQIKLGIESNVDVWSYANPNISAEEMRQKRLSATRKNNPQYVKRGNPPNIES